MHHNVGGHDALYRDGLTDYIRNMSHITTYNIITCILTALGGGAVLGFRRNLCKRQSTRINLCNLTYNIMCLLIMITRTHTAAVFVV